MKRLERWQIGRAVTQWMGHPPYVAWSLSGLPAFSIRKFWRKGESESMAEWKPIELEPFVFTVFGWCKRKDLEETHDEEIRALNTYWAKKLEEMRFAFQCELSAYMEMSSAEVRSLKTLIGDLEEALRSRS